jgi:hypothetical protein
VYHGGVTKLPNATIEVREHNTSSVTVGLYQKWSRTEVDYVYYQYQVDSFSNKCFSASYVTEEKFDEITIACTYHTKIALLEIFVTDDYALGVGDNATIPKCCYHEESSAPKASYMLQISCVPKCPTNATSRFL